MDEDFQEVNPKAEKFLEHNGKMIWDALALITGFIGTVVIAFSVQANPQHLSLMGREDANVPGVYDLIYKVASTSEPMVFAVINDQLFHIGITLLLVAFVCQFISIWSRRISPDPF